MATYKVLAQKTIAAPAQDVYNILWDYTIGHPAILPKPYFEKLIVLEGGQGAGSLIEVHMNVMGSKQNFTLLVSEPEPGHILQETDQNGVVTTQFIVEPLNGDSSLVTIVSEFTAAPGLRGWIEKIMNPSITKNIYAKELDNLAEYAGQ